MYNIVKTVVKKPLHWIGLDLVRHRPMEKTPQPPPLFDDPLEALGVQQGGGGTVAFKVPIDRVIHRKGFRYSGDGWHPFVETLREYAAGASTCYEDSILKAYYETHQPENAAEAIVGFDQAPETFTKLPPHLCYLSPWRSEVVDEIDQFIRRAVQRDGEEHGKSDIRLRTHGFKYHGPVHPEKGELEYNRLVKVYESIRSRGYDRWLRPYSCVKR